jgi:peptidoglycan hydrolase-like protein with peptidoglycan-binding domain
MAVMQGSGQSQCLIVTQNQNVTAKPIERSVGAGGTNAKADTLLVQELLNSVPPSEGGPDLLLAEDGLIGPKTQAAINKFQKKVLSSPDGRIDPGGPTIKALVGVICDSPAVPPGRLGLAARPNQVAGGPPVPAVPIVQAAVAILDAKRILREFEPRLMTLRFKLARPLPPTVAFCNKHFATGNSKVTPAEIGFINSLVGAIHFHVARFNAFGIQLIENVILFDPNDDKNAGWTVRGGDKLSTKQFEIYVINKKVIKAPGQSVFLTNGFAAQTGFHRHWTVLHDMAHFVGPRDGTGIQIDDHGTYADSPRLTKLTKFQKLHNAEIISLFLLEACVGTATIVALRGLALHRAHYNTVPRIGAGGAIVTS